jgi:hypothetical protein
MPNINSIPSLLQSKVKNSVQPKRPTKTLDDIHASLTQVIDYIRQSSDIPKQLQALADRVGNVDRVQKDVKEASVTTEKNLTKAQVLAALASSGGHVAVSNFGSITPDPAPATQRTAAPQARFARLAAAPAAPPTFSPAYGWYLTATKTQLGMNALTGSDGNSAIGFEASQLMISADGVTDGYQPLFAKSGSDLVFNVPFRLDGAALFDGTVQGAALASGAVTGGLSVEGALSAEADYTIRRDTSLVFVTARFIYRDDPATLNSGKKGQLQISVDGAALISLVNNDVSEGALITGDRGYVETLYTFQMANPTAGEHTFKAVSTWDPSLGTDTKVNIQVLEFAA